jgi:hypothetical protein
MFHFSIANSWQYRFWRWFNRNRGHWSPVHEGVHPQNLNRCKNTDWSQPKLISSNIYWSVPNNNDSLSLRANQGHLHWWKHRPMNTSTNPIMIITMKARTRTRMTMTITVTITIWIRITIRITIIITITISIVRMRVNISLPIHQNIGSVPIVINENDSNPGKWSLFHQSIIPSFREWRTNNFNQSNFIQCYPFNSWHTANRFVIQKDNRSRNCGKFRSDLKNIRFDSIHFIPISIVFQIYLTDFESFFSQIHSDEMNSVCERVESLFHEKWEWKWKYECKRQ